MTAPLRRADLDGLPVYSSVSSGTTPVLVRASSNEASGSAHPDQVAAVETAVRDAARYPVIGGEPLVERIATALALPLGRVAVGDGALTLLDRILLTFLTPGAEVVTAWRSYEAYPLSIRICHGQPVLVPLDGEGRHDLAAMHRAIGPDTRVVLVCNPNNPTGTALAWDALLDFLDYVPPSVLVILDEAYTEFAGPRAPGAALTELTQRPNLMVLRTFSKAHGLAGLRVGYALGRESLVGALRTVLPPFPVSSAAVAAACWSLDHPEQVVERVAGVLRERELLTADLVAHGLPVQSSAANFVWLPLGVASMGFAAACRDHGVLVRPFDGEGVRISVGYPDLRAALAPVLATWADRASAAVSGGHPR